MHNSEIRVSYIEGLTIPNEKKAAAVLTCEKERRIRANASSAQHDSTLRFMYVYGHHQEG